jgi:hypothetical protein
VKRGLIQSLHKRASTICPARQDLVKVISSLRSDLQLNGYPQGSIDSVINSKGSSHPNKEQKLLGSVYIPYVKGVSEKFRRIGNRYIRTSSKLNTLMKTRPERDRYRQHSASTVFPVNAAEVTLAKQTDFWPCGSVNTGTVSKRLF